MPAGGLPAVEAPFPVTAPHRVLPAPRPLGDAPHVILDAAWPASVERRLQRLVHDHSGVVVRDPVDQDDVGLGAALREAWRLLPWPVRDGVVSVAHLGIEVRLDDGEVRAAGPSRAPAATARLLGLARTEALLEAWLLSCSDDLVVMRRRGDEAVAELLAVAFPSGWPVRRRAGAPLSGLHAPVADGERLQSASVALSLALLTKGPFVQHVWGINPSGRLDRDPTASDAERPSRPPAADWWLRVERQTTMPLPHLSRALFTIRPYLVPLRSLTPPQREVLGAAIASMSPESVRYKGFEHVHEELVEWLRSPTTP